VLDVERLVAIADVARERKARFFLRDDVGRLVGRRLRVFDRLLLLRPRFLELIELGRESCELLFQRFDLRALREGRRRCQGRAARESGGDGEGNEFACHVVSSGSRWMQIKA
jgi:hypothetical protein